MLTFVFHSRKAASNLRKHGIPFREAASVFGDTLGSSLRDDQHSWDEERWIVIGMSERARLLFVVYTQDGSTVRLIGARPATAREQYEYEEGL